jgi:hypothetical protein
MSQRLIARMSFLLVLALLVFSSYTATASARFLHTITAAQAYGVANRFGERAGEDTEWAEEWEDECSRQTPWTFSCFFEVWSEEEGGPDCWREFDVASSAWNGLLRTEDWSGWVCDPRPTAGQGPPRS